MGGDAGFQGVEIVAALQNRDDPAFGGLIGDFRQFGSHPSEIVIEQVELRQRVVAVGIEPCRDHQQVGGEFCKGRKNLLFIEVPEGLRS